MNKKMHQNLQQLWKKQEPRSRRSLGSLEQLGGQVLAGVIGGWEAIDHCPAEGAQPDRDQSTQAGELLFSTGLRNDGLAGARSEEL